MTLDLPPELAHALADRARSQGTTPELLVLSYLRERFLPMHAPESATAGAGTLADFLAGHIGVLGSRADGAARRGVKE